MRANQLILRFVEIVMMVQIVVARQSMCVEELYYYFEEREREKYEEGWQSKDTIRYLLKNLDPIEVIIKIWRERESDYYDQHIKKKEGWMGKEVEQLNLLRMNRSLERERVIEKMFDLEFIKSEMDAFLLPSIQVLTLNLHSLLNKTVKMCTS